ERPRLGRKPRKEGGRVFAKARHNRLERCLAAAEQALVESSQMRLVAHGHQRRHIQGTTQTAAAPSTNPRTFFHRSARGEMRGVEPAEGYPLTGIQAF